MLSGFDLREARRRRGWTQAQAADRLGVSQAYVSLFEHGIRPVSRRLLARVQREYALQPTAWPFVDGAHCDPEQLAAALGGLGYPGFAHLKSRQRLNPAQALLLALKQDRLDSRTAAALPWVVLEYPDLDWGWLVERVKVGDCQNKLGFVVGLARQVAAYRYETDVANRLTLVEQQLERSRLAREDSLGQADMTDAERRWLRRHRPDGARRWNLLTDLRLEHLDYAT